jgi:DoxX-like protein
MLAATQSVPTVKTTIWAGRIISALAILFLAFDTIIKVLNLPPAVEATTQLGYPASLVVTIGIIELACLAVYSIPRTSILGAILLTGYLGGAIATQVRAGSPLFSVIFPVIIGVLIWGGLFLRDERLRALLLQR